MDKEVRAARAASLLQDEILNEVLDSIANDAIMAWKGTKVDDAVQREFAWMMAKSVDRIRDVLQGLVDTNLIESRRAVRKPF